MRSRARLGAAFGSLTGALGAGMLWSAPAPNAPHLAAISVFAVVALSFVGWLAAERVSALAMDLAGSE